MLSFHAHCVIDSDIIRIRKSSERFVTIGERKRLNKKGIYKSQSFIYLSCTVMLDNTDEVETSKHAINVDKDER